MTTSVLVGGERVAVRHSQTPGYQWEFQGAVESWSIDDRWLTRRGAVHYRSSGSVTGWVPVHELNHREIAAAIREQLAGAL